MLDILETISSQIHNGTLKPIICVGDIMLDRFYYGHVDRISPEAPVPVLVIKDEKLMLGGAGNVVANMAELGAPSLFVSVLGDDAEGHCILDMLNAKSKCQVQILRENQRQTTVKTRCVGSNQQIVRLDKESTNSINNDSQQFVINAVTNNLSTSKVVILSDYGKGILSDQVIEAIIKAANSNGARIIVDPKGHDYSKYRGAYLVTPNRKELADATGLTGKSDEQIIFAARQLMSKTGIKNVLVTRSEEGMTLVTEAGDVKHIRTTAREVYDVSGAGDTVVAVLTVALSSDIPLYEASLIANQAASVVVGKIGTASINLDELYEAILEKETISAEKKLFSNIQLQKLVLEWKSAGLTVGFTNGCFDLLHPGHVTLLEKCRSQCDRLIVALNTDKSVKRLKGDSRPVQSEISRAIIMASLQSVDAVVLFSEDTPLAIIEELSPNKLFKGGDYNFETVVGADFVKQAGGEVVLIDLVPDQSTTRLISKMNQK
ncbi:D-glycero-beta-D-manno-heptose-7-phosphate kinase [Methylomonas paludis]|uniref:Bifunctional protein HldE n=1 Tax=Methylomonas paludis TaxID=1173101 RepID=A0A975R9A8_9GAMM|nr:D-glycero-beta-D-manno-heptose-7-phosphate kinase [Methylomonas paludis]QWF70039.1 D-glycero-beta-D-manno-heptose-7-phosphate kinase [Methylomonas paludis]